MTIHVFVSGFVQGVGFRQYIRYKSKKLDVKGWIKNLPDGRVEAVLQGTEENVKQMIEYCRKGPFLAEVKNIEVKDISEQLFDSFDII